MAETKGTVQEMKRALSSLLDENERIAQAFKIEEKGVVVSREQADTFRSNLAKAEEIKALIDGEERSSDLRAYLAEESKGSVAVAAGASGERAAYTEFVKSLGEMFTDSDEFKSLIRSGGATMPVPFEVSGYDVTRMGRKDVYGSVAGTVGAHGFGTPQHDPLVPRNFRRARVRDLFPVARTSANLIDFFRVIGFGSSRLDLSSGASVVPDYTGGNFGLKPQSDLDFESAQAPVRTIAHWEAAHRNVLADEPQMQSTINNELLYGLRLTEDAQILNGTGTGEDLLGVLNTPNIQTHSQSAVAGDTPIDAIRRSITKVILAYYDATGIVIHPNNWEDIELTKGTVQGGGSDGHYVLNQNLAVGAESRLWSLPVVDTPAITENTTLVGAFGLGAQLYDREQASIRVSESHSDLFVRNAIVILAEERLALAVKRPEAFVKITLT